MYEHYCVLCSARKMTPKLCLAVTKRGKKTRIALMLENYCRINVTTENVPQLHLCLLQEELKLQAIVSKVDNFRGTWMGNFHSYFFIVIFLGHFCPRGKGA